MWIWFIRNRLIVGREVQGRARPGTIQKELVKSRLVKIGVRVQMRGFSVPAACVAYAKQAGRRSHIKEFALSSCLWNSFSRSV